MGRWECTRPGGGTARRLPARARDGRPGLPLPGLVQTGDPVLERDIHSATNAGDRVWRCGCGGCDTAISDSEVSPAVRRYELARSQVGDGVPERTLVSAKLNLSVGLVRVEALEVVGLLL